MVFALAGDSTMTTFMETFKKGNANGELAERDKIARMTLDAACEFQFQQQAGDGGG
jgi:hypothetical protein